MFSRPDDSSAAKRLVLFDIDGTLISCGSQVGRLFLSVLEQTFGTHGDTGACNFAGKTDPRIVHDLLSTAGLDRKEIETGLPAFRSRYLPLLEQQLDVRGMKLFAGVRELLGTLGARADTTLGLVTGNWRRGARAKLERFDLNRYFAFGAFGDDGIDRNDLPPIAIERARSATGWEYRRDRVWIVGDTPADVECGKAHGLGVLAVATGHWGRRELEVAGADRVVGSLAERGVCSVLLGDRNGSRND